MISRQYCRSALAAALAAVLSGCGATGQRELALPAFGVGVDAARGPFAVGAWQVTLETAQVGFGPAYFCATAGASSDLCPVAVAELARSGAIDALDATPQRLGDVAGVNGGIRSSTYDFAYSWFATQRAPAAGSGAPGGHSLRLAGRAVRGKVRLGFVADIDVVPRLRGTRAVAGASVVARLDGGLRLAVRIDPRPLLSGVDFDELARQGDRVVIAAGSRAESALVLALTAQAPPTLTFSTTPGSP